VLPTPVRAAGLLAQLETEIQKLAADLSASVVTVRAIRLGDPGSELREVYVGTGVVFDSGWVITTSSVVASRAAYSIEAPGQVPVPAELVEYNSDGQMAVFRAPTLEAPSARFDADGRLVPGQMLLVMGNAYGLTGAVSWGVAAGERYDGTWQVGVSVAPGASGSPVVNTSGEVVGLIVAALSERTAPELAMFAGHTAVMMPASSMLRLARQIMVAGHVGRAFLGIRPEPVDPTLARALGISQGLLVGAVSFGSPAYAAGLQSGDVLIEVAGRPVPHEEALRMTLADHCPGEEVTLSVIRNRKLYQLSAVLGQLPEILPLRPAVPPTQQTSFSTAAGTSPVQPAVEDEIRRLEERITELKSQGKRP
jgi:S1-C subfamily serine protease